MHDPEQLSWHLRLPPDLQRAAPELYRNIRAEGVNSVRQWVNGQHPSLEQKNSTQYQDLFMAATIIDYELAECKSEQALTHKLATSDSGNTPSQIGLLHLLSQDQGQDWSTEDAWGESPRYWCRYSTQMDD